MNWIRKRLAGRLALLLTLALAPLGLIAIYYEYEGWRTQVAAHHAGMITRTVDAVTGQRALLESAMLSAESLVPSVLERLDDPDACSEHLARFISQSRFFAFVGFIDAEGVMPCASESTGLNIAADENFEHALAEPRSSFTLKPSGSVTEQPVVLANMPVFENGSVSGYLVISIARQTLDLIATERSDDHAPSISYLVNHNGETLANTEDPSAELLPASETLQGFVQSGDSVFSALAANGTERAYALAELAPGTLYVLGSWNADYLDDVPGFNVARIAFPVLMWAASVAVVMLAVNHMVVRHLRLLNTKLRRFALGNRDNLARLPDEAPGELREIDSTFTKMARLIRRDEAEREDALREKSLLLKEVHHRVKNNLQLIASILNLQMRRLNDPEARAIVQSVQGRVRSLASIHRTLYEQGRATNTNATEFIQSILVETMSMAQAEFPDLEVTTDLQNVGLMPDRIIPATLLFAEALSNALKHVAPPHPDAPPQLKVSFSSEGGFAELRVWNSLSDVPQESAASGLGQELMTAFALQIHADLESGPVEDAGLHGWEMRLRLVEEPH